MNCAEKKRHFTSNLICQKSSWGVLKKEIRFPFNLCGFAGLKNI